MPLSAYRSAIDLDRRVDQVRPDWADLVSRVLDRLGVAPTDSDLGGLLDLLRGVLAPIEPFALADDLVADIEAVAAGVNATRRSTGVRDIAVVGGDRHRHGDRLSVWVGDITTLAADAIVNAANAQMLGCFIPNHACIDNAIHWAAGPRLRNDCATIMRLQAAPEPVGTAKITSGYALPARYVLHTAGPQLAVGAIPTPHEEELLSRSYTSCLDLAAEIDDLATVGFCAISTGVFAFPPHLAAAIALDAVGGWLDRHPDRFERIIFDCYTNADAAHYERALDA